MLRLFIRIETWVCYSIRVYVCISYIFILDGVVLDFLVFGIVVVEVKIEFVKVSGRKVVVKVKEELKEEEEFGFFKGKVVKSGGKKGKFGREERGEKERSEE